MDHVIRYIFLLALCLPLIGVPSEAQAIPQNLPDNRETFQEPDWPTPDEIRRPSGAPGYEYWQQRADYDLVVRLDTTNHRITGSQTITYHNNSPDTLHYLWVQLDQNLFKPGSIGQLTYPPNARWRGAFPEGGFDMHQIKITYPSGRTMTPEHLINDTRLRIRLAEPLPPGGTTVQLDLDWSFVVPEYGADRTGRFASKYGWVYQIAQWYPRMYVYDDVEGWHTRPYLGQGEFYTEFGTFDLSITVPRDMVVLATGTLQNPEEVLTEQQLERLEQARSSKETIHIIEHDELGTREMVPAGSGPLTWEFHAEQVRDVAWAASKAFIWDAAAWEDVIVMSAYPPEGVSGNEAGNPGWEQSTQMVRHSLDFYSERLTKYPYPVAINVAGVVLGMEYPMIMFCSVNARGASLFGVTDHEFGHIWFPMMAQNNERAWAWMDEGLNTFINFYSNQAYYSDTTAIPPLEQMDGARIASRMQSPAGKQPIMTRPDLIQPPNLGFLAYRKPAYGLQLLREIVIGPDRFDEAFRTYIRRWAYKHPQPSDFFRTIESVTGEQLGWFWNGWFYNTHLLDQSVDSVSVENGETHIHLRNRNELVMPVPVELTFRDHATKTITLPVEIWQTDDHHIHRVRDERTVDRVVVDPDTVLPDIQRANNTWSRSQ